uniref:Uncharacterized protein n=1 Tax=Arundo donax TaxID=35708 RepID=A0A0A9DUC0_ARUDO
MRNRQRFHSQSTPNYGSTIYSYFLTNWCSTMQSANPKQLCVHITRCTSILNQMSVGQQTPTINSVT